MASSSHQNSVSRDTVIVAFQLDEFINSGHIYAESIDELTRHVIFHLVKNNFRPAQQGRVLSARDRRNRSRSQSVEAPSWPSDWALDRSIFRGALSKFEKDTEYHHRQLQEPPSTGNTPPGTPPSTASNLSGNSGATTRATSAEETIYDRPIGPAERPTMGANITPEMQAVINAAIAQYVRENPPQRGEPGPPGPPGEAGADGANGSGAGGNSHLKPEDIGFFDNLFVCEGPLGTENNRTVFRDIYVFVDRLKDMAATKGENKVVEALPLCLRGGALAWHTDELSELNKSLLRRADLQSWVETLIKRFKEQSSVAVRALQTEGYTMADARTGKHPRAYVQSIRRHARAAELLTDFNQLMVAWNNLQLEFRLHIPEPTPSTTIEQFLE